MYFAVLVLLGLTDGPGSWFGLFIVASKNPQTISETWMNQLRVAQPSMRVPRAVL